MSKTSQKPQFDVFLSYHSVDKSWVTQLKGDLIHYGVSVWLDKDEIQPGEIFATSLEKALGNCRAVALIVSPEDLRSGWIEEEYYRALSLVTGKQFPLQIIPLIIGDVQIPGFLQSRNWIDFRDNTAYNENLWKLVWGITGQRPEQILEVGPRGHDRVTLSSGSRYVGLVDPVTRRRLRSGEKVVICRKTDAVFLEAVLDILDDTCPFCSERLYLRRLNILEQQAGLYGQDLPEHIQLEIQDIKKKIDDLRNVVQTISPESISAIPLPINVVSKPLRKLRVFLCHSSNDKPAVRELHQRLKKDGFAPWLDEEDILPGQNWEKEIPRAVRSADVVIVCLSKGSVSKKGYIQKEIRYALDVADEQPEGVIFIIPLRLQECDPPERLRSWQWVDYYGDKELGYGRLLRALELRASTLELIEESS